MAEGPEETAPAASEPTLDDASLQAIFDCLRQERGIDFSDYKPATMSRRILRRLGILGLEHVGDYVQTLRASTQERHALVRNLLVRVTDFFRDAEAFALLEREVIPDLLRSASERQTIRVWVPACSTGEEAYSIAMLFQEGLARTQSQAQVRIFATDVDRYAIEVAAQGVYSERIAEALTPQRLQRFFCKEQRHYRVSRHLREMLHFAPHNLMEDPPFTHVSLVSCRNCLIYLETAVQHRILTCFAYALRQPGYLLLGPSEACGPLASVFRIVHPRWKIYQKVSDIPMHASTLPSVRRPLGTAGDAYPPDPLPWPAYARLAALYGPPALILDAHYDIVWVLGEAHIYLKELSGALSLNILKRVRDELKVPVATALRRISQDGQEVVSNGIPIRINEVMRPIRLRVQWAEEGLLMKAQPHILVCFEPMEAAPNLPAVEASFDPAGEMTQRIYDLEQELAYTQGHLQTTVEALEAANEQLQSTNEELVTANEELQSTNEELHAVNEELYTVNGEYQNKIQELMQLNDDMDNLLRSTDVGTLFLDTALHVRKYTPALTAVIPLTTHDIGRPVDHLALPFAGLSLRQEMDAVMVQQQGVEKEVVSGKGDWFLLRLLPFVSEEGTCEGIVLSVTDITRLKTAEAVLQDECAFWHVFLDTFDMQIAVLDQSGRILHVNRAWRRRAIANRGEAVASCTGRPYAVVLQEVLGMATDVSAQAAQGLRAVLAGDRDTFTMTYLCPSTQGPCLMRMSGMKAHASGRMMVVHEDLTARRQTEAAPGGGAINPQCQPHQSIPAAGGPGLYPSEWVPPGGLAQNCPSVSSQ